MLPWSHSPRSRGTLTGWTNGPRGTSWSSTRKSPKSCSWRGTTPGTSMWWGPPIWNAVWQKNDLEVLSDTKLTSSDPLLQRRRLVSWVALGKALSTVRRRWSFPSALHWWGHTWSMVSSVGLPSTRETWTDWRESSPYLHTLLGNWL